MPDYSRYSCQAFFTVINPCPDVTPPLTGGTTDTTWISVPTATCKIRPNSKVSKKAQKELENAVREKMRRCYAVEIRDIHLNAGFWSF